VCDQVKAMARGVGQAGNTYLPVAARRVRKIRHFAVQCVLAGLPFMAPGSSLAAKRSTALPAPRHALRP